MNDLPALVGDLPVFQSEDYLEHVEMWRALEEAGDDVKWRQAAVAASLTAKWGEKAQVLSQFASEVGCSARRIYEYAATWKAFASARKSEILSFHHHTIAARAEEPEAAIERAEIEGLSTRELERDVSGKEPEPMERCPTCNGRGRVLVE